MGTTPPVPASDSLSYPPVVSLLTEERQAYLSVQGKGPPHVTPMLYGLGHGRFGFFAEAGTPEDVHPSDHEGAGAGAPPAGPLPRSGTARLSTCSRPSIVRCRSEPPLWRAADGGFTVRNADRPRRVRARRAGGQAAPADARRASSPSSPSVGAVVSPGELRTLGEWPGAWSRRCRARARAPRRRLAVGSTAAGPLLFRAVGPGARAGRDPRRAHRHRRVRGRPGRDRCDDYGAAGPVAKQGTLLKGETASSSARLDAAACSGRHRSRRGAGTASTRLRGGV